VVYEKKQLSKKILAIAASIAIAVAFMPMFGNFAYAASDEDTYVVTSPTNVEVEYTGQEPDLSQVDDLAQITVQNVADPSKTATLTRGEDYEVAAFDAGPGPVAAIFTTKGAYADKEISSIMINVKEASAPDEYTATLDASGLVYVGELDGLDDVKDYIWDVLYYEEGLIVLKNGTQKVYDYDLDITPDASVTNPKGFAGEKYNIKVKVSGQEAPVYEGTVEIQKFDLSKAFEVATDATATYTGAAQTPDLGALAVTAGEEGDTYSVGELAAADYTVKGYADNTNAGTAKATIEAKASAVNFTGAATVEFPIAQAEIGNATLIKLNGSGQQLAYTGKDQKPAVDITVHWILKSQSLGSTLQPRRNGRCFQKSAITVCCAIAPDSNLPTGWALVRTRFQPMSG